MLAFGLRFVSGLKQTKQPKEERRAFSPSLTNLITTPAADELEKARLLIFRTVQYIIYRNLKSFVEVNICPQELTKSPSSFLGRRSSPSWWTPSQQQLPTGLQVSHQCSSTVSYHRTSDPRNTSPLPPRYVSGENGTVE